MIGFEWDDEKNARNIAKHGIRFETAVLVFNDENRLELYDFERSYDEDRYIAIGLVDRVLFVVFVERTNTTRIISARPATRQEERMYYARKVHT